MTATYNYLGYGITDNQGKAKLEYDAQGNPLTHSYTGTCAGKVDIVASLDSEITESSLVSETFVVLDTLLYDNGCGADAQNCYALTENIQRIVEEDGTRFRVENASSPTVRIKKGTNEWLDATNPFIIEFYVVEMDNSMNFYTSGQGLPSAILINKDFAVGHTVKFKYDGTTFQLFYDNTPSTSRTITFTQNIGMYVVKGWGANQSFDFKIKDLKIYPI